MEIKNNRPGSNHENHKKLLRTKTTTKYLEIILQRRTGHPYMKQKARPTAYLLQEIMKKSYPNKFN